jgi:hypothetical protein
LECPEFGNFVPVVGDGIDPGDASEHVERIDYSAAYGQWAAVPINSRAFWRSVYVGGASFTVRCDEGMGMPELGAEVDGADGRGFVGDSRPAGDGHADDVVGWFADILFR